jgi:hypothetical protein
MIIVGADYHPGFQQIAFVDTETGVTESDDWDTPRKPKPFIAILGVQVPWSWKPVDTLV